MVFIRGFGCGASIIDESLDNELGESQNKEPEDRKGDTYIHFYKIFSLLLIIIFLVNLFLGWKTWI